MMFQVNINIYHADLPWLELFKVLHLVKTKHIDNKISFKDY